MLGLNVLDGDLPEEGKDGFPGEVRGGPDLVVGEESIGQQFGNVFNVLELDLVDAVGEILVAHC